MIVNKVPAVSREADRRYDELARIVGRKTIWQPPVPQRVIVNQAIGERRPIHRTGHGRPTSVEAFDTLWAKLAQGSARPSPLRPAPATSISRKPPRPSKVRPALPCTRR